MPNTCLAASFRISKKWEEPLEVSDSRNTAFCPVGECTRTAAPACPDTTKDALADVEFTSTECPPDMLPTIISLKLLSLRNSELRFLRALWFTIIMKFVQIPFRYNKPLVDRYTGHVHILRPVESLSHIMTLPLKAPIYKGNLQVVYAMMATSFNEWNSFDQKIRRFSKAERV